MEFRDVLRRRRMIRSYQEGRLVPADTLDAILAAALRTPSAGFTQGVSLLVLNSPSERETFWQAAAEADSTWLRGMRTAPVLVLVWTSEEAYLDRYADSEYAQTFLPKVEITLWVDDSRAEDVARKIVEVARTGRMGDGKIFILPAEEQSGRAVDDA